MKAFILLIDIAGRVTGILGPYDWTLRHCDAQVELYVRLYAIEPFINGVRKEAITYQCVMKVPGRRA